MSARPRTRPGLVALAAAATMLVLIGALGNPPTTRSLIGTADFSGFGGRLRLSLASFGWHVNDFGNDYGNIYLGNLLMDIAVVVLVFLLVVAVTARSGSFGRTFLGVWIAVLAAAVLGGYVRSAVVDESVVDPSRPSKLTGIFFSTASPGTTLIFAAMVFGLVAALVAAVVAVLARRSDAVGPAASYPAASSSPTSSSPTSYSSARYADTAAVAEPAAARREPWSAPPAARPTTSDDAERTTHLPAVDPPSRTANDDADHTRELPRSDGA